MNDDKQLQVVEPTHQPLTDEPIPAFATVATTTPAERLLVNPATGEEINLNNPDQLAIAWDEAKGLKSLLEGFMRDLEAEIFAATPFQDGSKTTRLNATALTLKITNKDQEKWTRIEEAAELLPQEKIAALFTITYKPKLREFRKFLGSTSTDPNEEAARLILIDGKQIAPRKAAIEVEKRNEQAN